MPIFEIEANGKTYEVDAPDQARALSAFRGFNGGQSSAPSGPRITQEAWGNLSEAARAKLSGMGYTVGGEGTKPLAWGDNPNERGSALDPFAQGTTYGWSDELRGASQGAMAGPGNAEMTQQYETARARENLRKYREDHPIASTALEIGGALLPTIIGGGAGLAAKGATMGTRAATGFASGVAQGAAYGAGAADGDLNDRLGGATFGGVTGGLVGAVAPAIGNKVANAFQRFNQGRILNAAAKNAPAAGEMKQAASALFDQADNANIMIQRPAFQRLFDGVREATAKFRPNQQLDPKAMGALGVLQDTYAQVMAAGDNVVPDLKDLHILRQAAQRAQMSTEGRDAMISGRIVDKIDEFMNSLKPGDIAGGADPKQAVRAFMDGKALWARANKVGLLEDAIETARNQASGFENGLRVQFRRILNNKKMASRFNSAELQAIQDVARGTGAANLAKLVGKFGFGNGNASNMLGGTIGFGLGSATPMGPIGGMLAAGGATLARRGSEKLTERAANRALGAAATENLRVLPKVPGTQQTSLEALTRLLSAPAGGAVGSNF